MQIAVGLVLAVAVSFLAYRAGSLSRGGAVAAAALGSLIYGMGGWEWAAVLLAFFVTSSVLSQVLSRGRRRAEMDYAKGPRRDAGQVLGNGGVAAAFVVLHAFFADATWPWIGYTAALAAANADTWATELGALAQTAPRLITHLDRRVEPGTSGAISLEGTSAAVLGAATIALLASALSSIQEAAPFWIVTAAGVLGSLIDSALGSSVQAMYVCERDGAQTEQHPLHRCGSPTVLSRGWPWLNNDAVNLACTAAGALLGCGLALALGLR